MSSGPPRQTVSTQPGSITSPCLRPHQLSDTLISVMLKWGGGCALKIFNKWFFHIQNSLNSVALKSTEAFQGLPVWNKHTAEAVRTGCPRARPPPSLGTPAGREASASKHVSEP